MLCSLRYNNIRDKGASALAAILKETMISNLECAAALAFAFLSAPADRKANTVCVPTGLTGTNSDQKAERLSQRVSKATQP